MKKQLLSILMLVIAVNTGCTRVEKPQVLSDTTTPYKSLGMIEVDAKAKRFSWSQIGWGAVELITLTFADTPSRAERYQAVLDEKMISRAVENYGADAIIRPEYWPDLASPSFPDGKIAARGEMIRYERFPAKKQ